MLLLLSVWSYLEYTLLWLVSQIRSKTSKTLVYESITVQKQKWKCLKNKNKNVTLSVNMDKTEMTHTERRYNCTIVYCKSSNLFFWWIYMRLFRLRFTFT